MLCFQTGEGDRIDVDDYINSLFYGDVRMGRCLIQPQGGRQSDRLHGGGGQLSFEGIFGFGSMTR